MIYLQKFKKFKIRIIFSGNYTLFVPLDVSFHRLPAWLLSSLDTDEKLRQAFILNHFVKKDVPLSSMGNEFLILNDRPGRHRIRTNIYFENTESVFFCLSFSYIRSVVSV